MPNEERRVFDEREFDYGDANAIYLGESGYASVVKRKSDGQEFLFKGYTVRNGFSEPESMLLGVVTEYIMGGVYKHVLGPQSPEIILISSGVVDGVAKLAVGSSWYKNLNSLSSILDDYREQEGVMLRTYDENHIPIIRGILSPYCNGSGTEILVVTGVLCGERDANLSNVGIVNNLDGNIAVRYDFANSTLRVHQEFIARTIDGSEVRLYTDRDLFKGALDRICTNSKDELLAIMDQRIEDVVQAGINFGLCHHQLQSYKWKLYYDALADNPEMQGDPWVYISKIELTPDTVQQACLEYLNKKRDAIDHNFDQLVEYSSTFNPTMEKGKVELLALDAVALDAA